MPYEQSERPKDIFTALRNLSRPQYDQLTTWNLIPLGHEIRSATNLISHGHSLLTTPLKHENYVDVVLNVLSVGVEHLLKLSLGFKHLERQEGWPSYLVKHGHKVVDLNRRLFKVIDRDRGAPEQLLTLANEVRRDEILEAMLGTFEHYAIRGRYFYLDELANGTPPSPGDGPLGSWITLLLLVQDRHPEIDDEELHAHHLVIAQSLESWLRLISAMAQEGLLGRRAIEFGKAIDPLILFDATQPENG